MLLPNIPNPPRCSFGSVIVEDNIYIVGGHINQTHHYTADNLTSDMNVFNISSQSWASLSPQPIASQGFQTFAYGNYIYALGGLIHVDNGYSPEWQYASVDRIDRYDINNDTWETLAITLPKPRSSYMAGVIGSTVYLIGGWNGIANPNAHNYPGGIFDPDIVMFDMSTETVSTAPNQIHGTLRRAGTAVSTGSSIVIAGGITPNVSDPSKMASDLVQVYGENGQFISQLPNLLQPNFAPGLGLNQQGDLFAFGGWPNNQTVTFTNEVWCLPLHASSWELLPEVMTQEKGFVNVVNLNSELFGLLGGALNGSGPMPAEDGYQSDVFENYSMTPDVLSKRQAAKPIKLSR